MSTALIRPWRRSAFHSMSIGFWPSLPSGVASFCSATLTYLWSPLNDAAFLCRYLNFWVEPVQLALPIAAWNAGAGGLGVF